MSAQTEIRIGSEFVGYRIDELVGRGGMGVVYRAYDLRLKRIVALKLMAPELALDQRFRERFAREAELAMSLEHPNVVPIHDAGDIDGRLYLAMRLVEGTDLRAFLHAEGALDPPRALAICSQVANALDAAHASGLVHRDVKPSNVLLDANEHVYLADFGLTRQFDDPGGPVGEGSSVGTPAYVAPEQIEGGPLDGRADVYSLGCLLYECLTGEAPFARGSRLAMAWAHLEEEPPNASERRPELPVAIDVVIHKSMAKQPDERHPTCAALITAAQQALGLGRPPIVRRHRLVVIAAVAISLLLAGALVTALIVRGSGGRATPLVTADSLVRIDPATNAVSAVVPVGGAPSATALAMGGHSVWVFNAVGPSLTEIDVSTNTVRNTTTLLASPNDPHAAGGPALVADLAGAWLIGADSRGRPYLTRVFSGFRGKREYRLPGKPRAIAVGYGAVWVVVHGAPDDQLLRINRDTGRVTNRIRFPSSPIDGLAAGLGSVWLGASATETLYRINPGSARVAGRIDLGGRDSGRPEVVLGSIWFGGGGTNETLIFDPRTLDIVGEVGGGSGGEEGGYDTGGYGSIWDYDTPTGTIVRWDGMTHQVASNIRVTAPPTFDGLCLTSLAAGAGAVWVTVNAAGGC